jgi:release factor glutamine methyltransferase
VRRRGAHVPVAYLVGEREFFSLAFQVDERVLVPRPETELLVEVAQAHLAACPSPVFADVGTGSGCIAVALLHELPTARAHGIDLEAGVLEVARANALRHAVLDRLTLHAGDLLAPLRGHPDHGRLAAVLSNPPYIVEDDPSVERGVREHEPHAALFVAGADPLVLASRLAAEALEALAPGGLFACEVGLGGAEDLSRRLAALGYAQIAVAADLAGIDRVVGARKPA